MARRKVTIAPVSSISCNMKNMKKSNDTPPEGRTCRAYLVVQKGKFSAGSCLPDKILKIDVLPALGSPMMAVFRTTRAMPGGGWWWWVVVVLVGGRW